MKISNETKVGAITAISIVILILGFNYLKGRNLTETSDALYAVFPDVKGLTVSNAVFINGLQVGKVASMHEKDKNMSGIIVTLNLTKDINIPNNSSAVINSELLGGTSIEILLGDSKSYVADGDTLKSVVKLGMVSELTKSINPAINSVNKTLNSLDMLIQRLNETLDPNTRNNLQSIIATLNSSTNALDRMINTQSAVISRTLSNVEKITATVAQNNGSIDSTLDNLQRVSSELAAADFKQLVSSLKNTMGQLETAVGKMNSRNSSLGLLLNDRQLYDEIRLTNRSLTTLLDDVRVNPKRYVSISVFGKKAKGTPLMQPVTDSLPSRQ
jgi:phospholipid/cholesterol/gamma-HCH transport system substrate-binding protein